ncbi:MAG TPA: biotin transporter BioY [Ruminococcaceae bacterium]|nr:biotin transporter BioY [Oscillospiraceae bacterium]
MKQKNVSNSVSVRNMVFIALFAAIICIMAPFSLSVGVIPISLGTFAIYLAGGFLGGKKGMAAVCVYILLGAVGLPVFTGFTGGFAKLLGVTGGYIIGYIPLALITGIFAEKNKALLPLGMVLGTLACYTFGTAWFMISTGSELVPALLSCVVPFLIGDAIKIAAASAVCIPLRSRLSRIMGN